MFEVSGDPIEEMEMVGSPIGNCDVLDITGNDRITEIHADSDGSHIRHMLIVLASGRTADFGGYRCDVGEQGKCSSMSLTS